MSCRGFYHQVGNSRYSGRILPTLSSSYGRIIPTCERFFGAGWIYHLSSKTPSVYMPVWWDSSCFPTFLQNRAVYHPVRQYLMRGWQRTGSISGVDGSARAVFRAWMAAHGAPAHGGILPPFFTVSSTLQFRNLAGLFFRDYQDSQGPRATPDIYRCVSKLSGRTLTLREPR